MILQEVGAKLILQEVRVVNPSGGRSIVDSSGVRNIVNPSGGRSS